MQRIAQRLRRYLVTGLIVIAPVGVTVFVLSWLFQTANPNVIGAPAPEKSGWVSWAPGTKKSLSSSPEISYLVQSGV